MGVPRGVAVDLRLTRIVKQAELARVDNQAAGADLLRTGQINAYAAPRPALLGMSAHLSGSHVLEDSFATISFAAFVPKGHDWESGIRRRVPRRGQGLRTHQIIYRARRLARDEGRMAGKVELSQTTKWRLR